jgi:hypothetical protein
MFDQFVRSPYRIATSDDYTSRFATSWFLSPLQLAIWRGVVALYAFVVIFIGLGQGHAGQSFSYFTVLGYWGLAFYYAVSCAHSISFWMYGQSWLQRWSGPLQWAHSIFYTTITTFPFVVTGKFKYTLFFSMCFFEMFSWNVF